VPSPHIHIPYSRTAQYLGLIRQHRLDLEIYFSGDSLDLLTLEDAALLGRSLDYGPSLSFHAPFMDLSPGAVDARVRAVTLERFHHTLDLADILRPRCIVFHSGYEKWKYSLRPDIWLDQSLLTWKPLLHRAEGLGVKIAIENIFEDEPSNLRLLMEKMGSPGFGICFDTGHCHLFSSVPLETWMESLGEYIVELHLHDNDRSADQHLPMGEGTFDFPRFFELLGDRDCVYTIEAHTPEHVMRSREYLDRLLKSGR
jgi:sugar phosphate isomerase/epimerase